MYRCHKSWGDTCVACPLLLSFSFLVPRREREGRRWSRVWRWSSTRTCTAHARAGRGRHQMSGRPGCRRGWAARTGQQRRTVCGNIPCPRDKRGPFALAAGWSGRPGCRRGWAATMSVLMQRISNRQKNRAVAVSPRSNRTVAPCNTQPRRKQLSRGTARQPRPLAEVVARYRATTSRDGLRAATSPLNGMRDEVVARSRDNLPWGARLSRGTQPPIRGEVVARSGKKEPGCCAVPRDNLP